MRRKSAPLTAAAPKGQTHEVAPQVAQGALPSERRTRQRGERRDESDQIAKLAHEHVRRFAVAGA